MSAYPKIPSMLLGRAERSSQRGPGEDEHLLHDLAEFAADDEATLRSDPVTAEGRIGLSLSDGIFSARPNTIPSGLATLIRIVGKFLRRLLLFLVPSFIAQFWCADARALISTENARYTAYLDGLRGVAAWAVMNAHLSSVLCRTSGASWGRPDGHGGHFYEPWKLPILRLVYAGDFSVAIFFVISGFALSISPISSMRKSPRNRGDYLYKLAGSILRRPLRLYGPAWASMFIFFALSRTGFFDHFLLLDAKYSETVPGWTTIDQFPMKDESFWHQVNALLIEMFAIIKIFDAHATDDGPLKYNGVLWTVKLEFRISFMLLLAHAALWFMRRRSRTAILSLLTFLAIACWAWDLALFWVGFILADYSLFSLPPMDEGSLVKHSSHRFARRKTLMASFWWLILLFGAYIGTWPTGAEQSLLYSWLVPFVPFGIRPVTRWWPAIGAALCMVAITKLPVMIRFYSSPVINYMGKISFALYLVHLPIARVISKPLFYYAWSLTGNENYVGTIAGFCLAYPVTFAMVLWAADVFWRAVDMPCVRLGATLQKRLFEEA